VSDKIISNEPFPAIVLSYDRHRQLAEHMIACYEALWPDHPFVFHVPFQEHTGALADAKHVRLVPAPREICQTVLTLLEPFDDEAWVYWCIDDYYPIRLDLRRMRAIVEALRSGRVTSSYGLNVCSKSKKTRIWRNRAVSAGETIKMCGLRWVEIPGHEQIWVHQFIRAGVLRHIFETIPEPSLGAKEMDGTVLEVRSPDGHSLHLCERDLIVLGESTSAGRPFRNYLLSLSKKGMVPDTAFGGKSVEKQRIRGKVGAAHFIDQIIYRLTYRGGS
jgi:hypothetical protein